MTLSDHLENMVREMRSRIIAAPFFLKCMIAPVDTYLREKTSWHVFSERSRDAIACWDLAKPDIREVLETSWYPEVEFMQKICRALCDKDFDIPADEDAFRAELVTALEEYVSQPEIEDRIYLIY